MEGRYLVKQVRELPGQKLYSAAGARRGGSRWETQGRGERELWGGEEDPLCWLRRDWLGREETALRRDDWGRRGIRHAWLWGVMVRTRLHRGGEPGYEVRSRGCTDPSLLCHLSPT